jgi:hypothetical protein
MDCGNISGAESLHDPMWQDYSSSLIFYFQYQYGFCSFCFWRGEEAYRCSMHALYAQFLYHLSNMYVPNVEFLQD